MIKNKFISISSYFSRTPLGIAKIVLVDQVFFAPVALTSFYGGLSAMEGKSIQEIKEELKVKVPKTWAVSHNYIIDKVYS